MNMKPYTKKIVLENGQEFYGYGFGADKEAICEIVFNTSMVGYQEIMSDPSYTDQMVVMTYPLIGNYGMADEDYETKTPTIGGMIVREYNDSPSNFRYTKTLNEVFEEHDIPAIWGVDTRELTRIIREHGVMNAAICDEIPADLTPIETYAVTGVVEAVTAGLVSIWFVPGAVAGLIDAMAGAGLLIQLVLFLAASAAALAATRPLVKKLSAGRAVPTNADRVLGRTARVTETIDNDSASGAVYVDGKTWTARSAD